MEPRLRQELRQGMQQGMRLALTPQMRQALHLMQTPQQELGALIAEQVELNPILEIETESLLIEEEQTSEDLTDEALVADTSEPLPTLDATDDHTLQINDDNFEYLSWLDNDYQAHFDQTGTYHQNPDDQPASHLSLYSALMSEARAHFAKEQVPLAQALIGNFDDSGLLTTPVAEIADLNGFDEEALREILAQIRTFAPIGVGATSVQEALLLQLEADDLSKSLAYTLVRDHYDDLLHQRLWLIERQLKVSRAAIHKAVATDLARLGLHPTSDLPENLPPLTPDILIAENDGDLSATVDTDQIPSIRINRRYLQMLHDPRTPDETRRFLLDHLGAGKWLLRALEERSTTLKRIANHLIATQSDYLRGDRRSLKPMTMRSVAQTLNLHESTITRAVANKFLSCPGGTLPLRTFFTHAYHSDQVEPLSATTVHAHLTDLIESEDSAQPYTDEQLSTLLAKEGITCSRRTIAKHRATLNIPNRSARRR